MCAPKDFALFGVASLRRNKVDRGKARSSMPFRTLSRISRERSGAEQNTSVCNLVSPYRMCPVSFSFSGLDGAEITLFQVPHDMWGYTGFRVTRINHRRPCSSDASRRQDIFQGLLILLNSKFTITFSPCFTYDYLKYTLIY